MAARILKKLAEELKKPTSVHTAWLNRAGAQQGCQICLGTTHQNGENIPQGQKNRYIQMAITYTYQIAGKLTEWARNIPTSFIARHSKIYPNRDFVFENVPSGNPGAQED
jgi:hypothetical protein